MGHGEYLDDTSVDGSEERPDLLGRRPFAEHIAKVLSQVRRQSESSVIALVGPWGSGKTSVLEMTEHALTKKPKSAWIVTWFNPWAYSDIESLLVGFFAELRRAMPEGKRWNTTRQRLSSLGAAVTPLAGAAQFAGINGTDIAKHVQKVIDSGLSATATHAKAEQALSKQDRPILVILDDLDRLEADELLLVLKLVRMIGRLPNVYYLLSYDEQTLMDVLFDSAIVGQKGDRARDFLEKLVQVKLDLPVLRNYQRNQLLEAGINHLLRQHDIDLSEEQAERVRASLEAHLLYRLASPRSIRRLIGQLDAMLPAVQDEIDFADFFILTWLRLEESGAYQMLVDHRDAVVGAKPSVLSFLNDTPEVKQNRQKMADTWRERLVRAGVEEANRDDVEGVISQIFPAYDAETKARRFIPEHVKGVASLRRARNPHYFDRYFAFDVPGEDLRDAVARQALAALAADDHSDENVLAVRKSLTTDADRVIEKLEMLLPEVPDTAIPLLILLRDVRASLPRTTRLFRDPVTLIESFAMRSLMKRDSSTALASIEAMCATLEGVDLLLPGLETLSRGKASWYDDTREPSFPDWAGDAVAIGARALAQWFATMGIDAFAAPTDAGLIRWYSWRRLDSRGAFGWLEGMGRQGRSVLPILEAFVSESTLMGVARKSSHLNSDLYPVDILVPSLGEEAVRAAISDLPAALSLPERMESNSENRRLIAVTHLRQFLDEHVEQKAEPAGDNGASVS